MNKRLPPRLPGRMHVRGNLCRQIKRFWGRRRSRVNTSCCRTQEGAGKRWTRYRPNRRLTMAHLNIYSCIRGRRNHLPSLGRSLSAEHKDASKVAVNARGRERSTRTSCSSVSHARRTGSTAWCWRTLPRRCQYSFPAALTKAAGINMHEG